MPAEMYSLGAVYNINIYCGSVTMCHVVDDLFDAIRRVDLPSSTGHDCCPIEPVEVIWTTVLNTFLGGVLESQSSTISDMA
jgi:hypothetical protein